MRVCCDYTISFDCGRVVGFIIFILDAPDVSGVKMIVSWLLWHGKFNIKVFGLVGCWELIRF
jgi:hypothetical protein